MLSAVASGAALTLSESPHNYWFLAIVGLAVLYRALDAKPARQRFLIGWIAALVMFGFGLAWQRQFSTPGWLVLTAFEAAFVGFACAAVPDKGKGRPFVFVAALAFAEAMRVRWPWGGLPMGGMTTGQASGPLSSAVAVVGEHGLVVLLALLAVGLRQFISRSPARWTAGWFFLALATVPVIVGDAVNVKSSGEMRVATVQGGGVQALTRDQQDARAVFARHYEETSQVVSPVDLIVWPENVIDVDAPIETTQISPAMSSLAQLHDAPIVAGVVESENRRFRNAVVVWNADGTIGSRYEKVHRVPFGEYVPFRSLVDRVADLSQVPYDAVEGKGPETLRVGDHTAGVVVSFEGLFATRARAATREGGEILLVPTNASSYKSANVAKSQVQAARLRAIETGRWVVQASPTGISTIVDNSGHIVAESKIGPPAVLEATASLSSTKTPYTKLGDAPTIIISGLILLLSLGRRAASRSGLTKLIADRREARRRARQPISAAARRREARQNQAE